MLTGADHEGAEERGGALELMMWDKATMRGGREGRSPLVYMLEAFDFGLITIYSLLIPCSAQSSLGAVLTCSSWSQSLEDHTSARCIQNTAHSSHSLSVPGAIGRMA